MSEPKLAARTYQGTVMVEEFTVKRPKNESCLSVANFLWVPADQADFEIAAQLFEPEAPDSMLRWGLFSTVFERKEYIDSRTLEELATAMLEDDEPSGRLGKPHSKTRPSLPTPRARYLWWYRRTPYWDEQVGLLPVFRVMELPTLPAIDGQ